MCMLIAPGTYEAILLAKIRQESVTRNANPQEFDVISSLISFHSRPNYSWYNHH